MAYPIKNQSWLSHSLRSHTSGELQALTRIPAPTLAKFQSGEWTPKERTLTKLWKVYQSDSYEKLRDSGLSRKEANKIKRKQPEEISRITKLRHKYVKEISKKSGIPEKSIKKWMTFSSRTQNNWDAYVKAKSDTWLPRDKYIRNKIDKDILATQPHMLEKRADRIEKKLADLRTQLSTTTDKQATERIKRHQRILTYEIDKIENRITARDYLSEKHLGEWEDASEW